jgi:hypothetical protein
LIACRIVSVGRRVELAARASIAFFHTVSGTVVETPRARSGSRRRAHDYPPLSSAPGPASSARSARCCPGRR